MILDARYSIRIHYVYWPTFCFPPPRNQRNKLKLDNMTLPSPERHRPLRHLYSSDNMHVPPFNIPNLRIEQRKTSSAEDMQRKNSTGKKQQSLVCVNHRYDGKIVFKFLCTIHQCDVTILEI